MKTLIAALVLVSTAAHAERLAPKRSELRQVVMQKPVKPLEHAPSRAALNAPTEVAAPVRGLEINDVIAKVNTSYVTGLQRCYRKSLAIDPTVSGKLDLQFKVAADGKVSSLLQGDGIERCLASLISTWRFGVALDDAAMPTEATFKVTLVLQ